MTGQNAIIRHEPMEIVSNPNYFPMQDITTMAAAMANSRLFGVQNAEQALALMLVAQSEGKHPATIARDYDIIFNKPAKKSEAMMRDFLQSGGKVEWIETTDICAKAKFSHPQGGEVTIDWTIERARKAGLTEKKDSMYGKYPRRMLTARCISEGIRTIFPMATSGVYTPEEVGEIENEAPPVSRTEQAKQIVKEKVAAAAPVKQVENTAKPKPEPEIIDADASEVEESPGLETEPEPEPTKPDETRRNRLGAMVDHCCEAFGYEREHAAKVVLPAFLAGLSKRPKDMDDEGVFNLTLNSLKKKQKVQIEALVKAHQKKTAEASA